MRNSRPLKWTARVALLLASLSWALVTCYVVVILGESALVRVRCEAHKRFPGRYSVPLDEPVVDYLCDTLQLDPGDNRCLGDDVYIGDFLSTMEERYEAALREQVDGEVGAYLVRCDEWIATESDGVFQRCYYDFHGDGVYVLRIDYWQFYPNPRDATEVPKDSSGGSVRWLGIPFQDRDLFCANQGEGENVRLW